LAVRGLWMKLSRADEQDAVGTSRRTFSIAQATEQAPSLGVFNSKQEALALFVARSAGFAYATGKQPPQPAMYVVWIAHSFPW